MIYSVQIINHSKLNIDDENIPIYEYIINTSKNTGKDMVVGGDIIDCIELDETEVYDFVEKNKNKIIYIDKEIVNSKCQDSINLYDPLTLGVYPRRNIIGELSNYVYYVGRGDQYGKNPISYTDILICGLLYR